MNEDLEKNISRRTTLKGAAAVMGLALASTLTGKASAEAEWRPEVQQLQVLYCR